MKPGKTNSLLDIAGLSVGSASNDYMKTGVTAVFCDIPTVASSQILGGAPGTREVSLLEPHQSVETIDAVVLSGGSAFGLDAASGVQAWLREQGRGFQVGSVQVPIVPTAIIFDLFSGEKKWGRYPPYRELGYEAATKQEPTLQLGSEGAATGALVAGLKGGLGSASLILDNGITIAALVVVNSVGSPIIPQTGQFWSAPFELDGEFGNLGFPKSMPQGATDIQIKFRSDASPKANTTIAVIATDAKLTKAQAKRLAISAHDGYSRAIWPIHTPMDGDIVFSLSTGTTELEPDFNDWIDLGAHAASVMARAIARGIYLAEARKNDLFPSWQEKFG